MQQDPNMMAQMQMQMQNEGMDQQQYYVSHRFIVTRESNCFSNP